MILYLGQVRRDGGPGGGVLGIISGEGGAHDAPPGSAAVRVPTRGAAAAARGALLAAAVGGGAGAPSPRGSGGGGGSGRGGRACTQHALRRGDEAGRREPRLRDLVDGVLRTDPAESEEHEHDQ